MRTGEKRVSELSFVISRLQTTNQSGVWNAPIVEEKTRSETEIRFPHAGDVLQRKKASNNLAL